MAEYRPEGWDETEGSENMDLWEQHRDNSINPSGPSLLQILAYEAGADAMLKALREKPVDMKSLKNFLVDIWDGTDKDIRWKGQPGTLVFIPDTTF